MLSSSLSSCISPRFVVWKYFESEPDIAGGGARVCACPPSPCFAPARVEASYPSPRLWRCSYRAAEALRSELRTWVWGFTLPSPRLKRTASGQGAPPPPGMYSLRCRAQKFGSRMLAGPAALRFGHGSIDP